MLLGSVAENFELHLISTLPLRITFSEYLLEININFDIYLMFIVLQKYLQLTF